MRPIGSATIISIAFALLFAAIAPPFARAQDAIDRLDMRAHAAFDAGQFDDAIKYWKAALKLDPKNATDWFNLAAASEGNGDSGSAITDYSEAIRLDPADPDARARRASVYEANGRKDDAAADYAEVTKLRPGDLSAHAWLAQYHIDKGEIDKALGEYTAVIQAYPDSPTAYYDRGTFYLNNLRDFDKAIPDLTAGIKLQPRSDAYSARALAYLGKGDFASAITDCNSALDLSSQDAEAFLVRGMSYQLKGDKDKALDDFNQAIKLNPQYADAYARRGLLLDVQGGHDKAMADFDQALKLDPNNAEAYSDRAQAWLARHQYDKALDDLKKTVEIGGPADADGLNELAWFYATCPVDNLRDGPKAAELAAKACELTNWKDPGIIDTLAAAEAETGKWDAAVKHQKQALEGATAQKLDAKTLADIASRVPLYEQKKPYRDLTGPPQ